MTIETAIAKFLVPVNYKDDHYLSPSFNIHYGIMRAIEGREISQNYITALNDANLPTARAAIIDFSLSRIKSIYNICLILRNNAHAYSDYILFTPQKNNKIPSNCRMVRQGGVEVVGYCAYSIIRSLIDLDCKDPDAFSAACSYIISPGAPNMELFENETPFKHAINKCRFGAVLAMLKAGVVDMRDGPEGSPRQIALGCRDRIEGYIRSGMRPKRLDNSIPVLDNILLQIDNMEQAEHIACKIHRKSVYRIFLSCTFCISVAALIYTAVMNYMLVAACIVLTTCTVTSLGLHEIVTTRFSKRDTELPIKSSFVDEVQSEAATEKNPFYFLISAETLFLLVRRTAYLITPAVLSRMCAACITAASSVMNDLSRHVVTLLVSSE